MRQNEQECEANHFENIQCALDIEHTVKTLEAQLCHEPHSSEEVAQRILKAACKFYDADWCGLLEIDLDLKIWTPFWWYNDGSEDKTTALAEEFESAEFLDRWVQAVRHGEPMVVPNAEEIRDTYPAEYALYRRLGVKSVLGTSLVPRPVALLAIRNPKRYISETSILRLLAYVLLVAYKDKKMEDSLSRAFAPENIESSRDVFISLFGELKIYTSRGVLREADLKSPKISRLLTYLLLSQKSTVTSLEIVHDIWPEELEGAADPGKNAKYLIYRFRQAFSSLSEEPLVISTPFGYQLNPKLHITTDFQKFDELCIAATKATSVVNKVNLLEKAVDLYHGKLLSSADGDHWLVHPANRYHLAYIGIVNELLQLLMNFSAHDLIYQYAATALTIAPENTKAYYWLILSYRKQNMDDLAAGELGAAKQKLSEEEYQKLLRDLKN